MVLHVLLRRYLIFYAEDILTSYEAYAASTACYGERFTFLYCHVLRMGSVTKNSTWTRIDYRIHSLRRV
jgi:hypothetical protein